MPATYNVLVPPDPDLAAKSAGELALDVLIGLSEMPKRLPCKYFYDAAGSRLFARITQLPEYYLTACEFEIFETHRDTLASLVADTPFNLVELGPGDGRKTQVLLEHFLRLGLRFDYIPIDISEAALQEWTAWLQAHFPQLSTYGLVADYFEGLHWLTPRNQRRNLVLFMGSNIGNFHAAQARMFLYTLWNVLNEGDYVVTGFDLKKDIPVLLRAYNDTQGITRDFNLNLLRRINRELGGRFDLARFEYYSTYDVFSGAIESYLVSLAAHTVWIERLRQSFSFQAWEPIHTEYSYKYLESDIAALAKATGFALVDQLYDSRRYFTDAIWRVEKQTAHPAG